MSASCLPKAWSMVDVVITYLYSHLGFRNCRLGLVHFLAGWHNSLNRPINEALVSIALLISFFHGCLGFLSSSWLSL